MLEMLMLLGLGLVAAGAVGMTGIGTDGTAAAEAQAATTTHYSKDIDSQDGGTLAQIRAMGGSLNAAAAGAAAASEAKPSDVAHFVASEPMPTGDTTDIAVAEVPETAVDDMSDPPEMLALLDRLGNLTDITVTSASFSDDEIPEITNVEAGEDTLVLMLPGQDISEQPAPDDLLLAEADADDDVPEITDFVAGEETLVLMLPDDMDDATTVRIEPAGETGADAAVVLEDARGSVMAAVIKSGYGLVTPQDIELQRG